jgi:branched-chain amino acid transport system ATP-binding protein
MWKTLLELRDVTIGYGPVKVVRGISAFVRQGEIVAVLGPNGAGKTTIVKAVVGLLPIAGGDIFFEETRVTGIKAHRMAALGVALVPEGRGVFPKMSVEENLKTGYFFLKEGAENLEERLEAAYRRFPLLGQRKKQVAGTLSGGEQSMLAISRAMMSDPKLLILDEPSLGLSPKLVEQTFDIIRELNASGMSVFLIEQNAAKAISICTRGYILQSGTVSQSGSRSELMSDERVLKAYFSL